MTALWGLAIALCCLIVVSGSPTPDGSVLQALLESQYSEWMELVERAQMLHPLEQLVASGHKLTIFAPQNNQLHSQVKAFVLKPSNAHLLKKMVEFHVLSQRITEADWRHVTLTALSTDFIALKSATDADDNVKLYVGDAEVVAPDVIVRVDGVVHGVDQMLLPMSVQNEYVAFTTKRLGTPLPTGAPTLESRRAVLLEKQYKTETALREKLLVPPVLASPPSIAHSPAFAPAPGPGPSGAPHFRRYHLGEEEVATFIDALYRFGGYSEFAQLLVEFTSLGSEISNLVNEGYKLTILAPEDKAWTNALSAEQLISQTAIEHILQHHIITEYQTEESMYTTLKRTGTITFNSLSVPLKHIAHVIDGQVVFGEGEMQAGIFDHDIFTDGRISVQGINRVIVPPEAAGTPIKPTKKKMRSLSEFIEMPSFRRPHGSGGSGSVVTGAMIMSSIASSIVLLVTGALL